RLARTRGGGNGASLLATGRGPTVARASALAREPFLAVAELAGTAAQGRILLAAPITLAEIETWFAGRIETRAEIAFDAASLSLRGRQVRRLGAVVLAERRGFGGPAPGSAALPAGRVKRFGGGRPPLTQGLPQRR